MLSVYQTIGRNSKYFDLLFKNKKANLQYLQAFKDLAICIRYFVVLRQHERDGNVIEMFSNISFIGLALSIG